jgi:hypothetical protein
MVDALDPSRKQKLAAQKRARQLLATLGIPGDVKLTEYEMLIASQLVDPASINISFKDIAGLEQLVAELRQAVILPIQKRSLFANSSLMAAPKGVLLHGPPGCGKTMIAKATARYQYRIILFASVVDPEPDPQGSETFCRIRIRIRNSMFWIRIRLRIRNWTLTLTKLPKKLTI